MTEPDVRVFLISRLEGLFSENGSDASEAYQRLTGLGVRVVFVTSSTMETAWQALSGLENAPALVAGDSVRNFDGSCERLPEGYHPPVNSLVEQVLDGACSTGDIRVVTAIGFDGDEFLNAADCSAVVANGAVPGTGYTYICEQTGPSAWGEWSLEMTRTVRIINSPRERARRKARCNGHGMDI